MELDRLLIESVTALVSEGLVVLDEIAVDGTKIRSPAASRSFTRGGRLERIERQAAERVERLKREVASDPAAGTRRRQAAQERAAREATAKVAKARAALERLREEKAAREKTHPQAEKEKSAASVSLTDLEARRMRFPDGAVRAGYNLQTAAVPDKGLIVAVKTTDRRNDQGLARPLVDEVARRYGRAPKRALFDEGYAARADVEGLAGHPAGPVTVYMPPPSEKPEAELGAAGRASRQYKRAKEPQAVKDWRGADANRARPDHLRPAQTDRAHPRPLQEPRPRPIDREGPDQDPGGGALACPGQQPAGRTPAQNRSPRLRPALPPKAVRPKASPPGFAAELRHRSCDDRSPPRAALREPHWKLQIFHTLFCEGRLLSQNLAPSVCSIHSPSTSFSPSLLRARSA